MFCPNCGKKIEDDSVFCPYCGSNTGMKEEMHIRKHDSKIENNSSGDDKNKVAVIIFGVVIAALSVAIIIGVIKLVQLNNERTDDSSTDIVGTDVNIEETPAEEAVEEVTPEESVSKETQGENTKDSIDTFYVDFVDVSTVNLSQYTKATLLQAAATSTIVQEGVDNSAPVVMDGDETTSWQEGVDGVGIGESLTMEFTSTVPVKYITFKNGNWKNDQYYNGNNRPRKLLIQMDHNVNFEVEFPEEKKEFCVELSQVKDTKRITVVIEDVYKGSTYDDTCIAEIGVYGER